LAIAAFLLLALLQGVLLFCLVYHYLMAAASLRQPPLAPATGTPVLKFAIAIPAHNEAAVLPATLSRLQELHYPQALVDIHVVADHCSDDTAEVAKRGGATVHVRDSLPRGRKAYPLQWLLERLVAGAPVYDAVAIFDADSLVDPGFLQAVEAHLHAGARVVQGQHIVSNPQDSWLAAMAAVDMRLNNRLRNQSRRNLGVACRLMGDAMVLEMDVLKSHGWQGESLTEDREYGYELLLRGIRARYVPEAKSYGQAASRWRQAEPQRLRWYQGLGAMQRRLAGRLLAGAVRQRSLAVLEGAIELLMPSYSFLAALSAVNFGLILALRALALPNPGPLGMAGSGMLLAAWAAYPLVGLAIDRAPRWAFQALLIGPLYLVWRLWIGLLVRSRGERIAWIRTSRREEGSPQEPRQVQP